MRIFSAKCPERQENQRWSKRDSPRQSQADESTSSIFRIGMVYAAWARRKFTSCSKCARRSSLCSDSNSISPCCWAVFFDVCGTAFQEVRKAEPISTAKNTFLRRSKVRPPKALLYNQANDPTARSHALDTCPRNGWMPMGNRILFRQDRAE